MRNNLADTYSSFNELRVHETPGQDYSISVGDVGSTITIIAPHGGKIEPRTSDITRRIAGKEYNHYCFEGIKADKNGRLHITSHHFDEPTAVDIISKSHTVVAIHAHTGTDGMVYMGGLDYELTDDISRELTANGIGVLKNHPKFQGTNPNNICNRGKRKKGVQLEVSRDLRDSRKKIALISEAVKAALERIQNPYPKRSQTK
jgi:phage replication-related protein YjqB (UPF0714/DUF867 family)